MIPIIATRNTADVEEQIASGRPRLGSTGGVDPTVYENATGTAAKVPYLLSVPSKGSVSAAEFASAIASASGMNEIDVRMVVNATYEVIEELVREYGAVKVFSPMGSDVLVRGAWFLENLTVTIRDEVAKVETPATVKEMPPNSLLVVMIPHGLDTDHKHNLFVIETIDGESWAIPPNKAFEVGDETEPYHEIMLVKQGARADNRIALSNDEVVCTVRHGAGDDWHLAETGRVKITVRFMEEEEVVGVLNQLTDISATETEVRFKNTTNTTSLIDGDWWNKDVTLEIRFSYGTRAQKTLRFLKA